MRSTESNKAKIANRVIEVLDFFDDNHTEATVMDIVRKYNRPQSSTSELLSSLVNLGLLYKDPVSRSYSPTPRAALLGAVAQPDFIRDGQLMAMVDRLVAQTGLAIAVFGMVGLNVQIFSWRGGNSKLCTARHDGFSSGMQERMTDSAAGMLLLSTITQPRRDGMIRRLNAEAPESKQFPFSEMSAKVEQVRQSGFSCGMAGFGSIADTCAVLLPNQSPNRPIAIGFVYEPSHQVDAEALRQLLVEAVSHCEKQPPASASVLPMSSAA
ncbi:IclR family transcriptional regulator [Novosphingobium sp. AAP83]|uniref:helix-turn-helix domain-containing protein n=1 Tax=Novosphingobium sp. AAP83 TaxID=1523425 RepID=UPI0006B94E8D|nr:helix-turn-helix domain-containing protein [Novosphingobium sp. AAP83]KPF91803.1 IclR family transcriptional regulator [Novosphingobium sp. AAP83]